MAAVVAAVAAAVAEATASDPRMHRPPVQKRSSCMDIKELREQIDEIDRQLVDLYCRRMETARAIGRYKRANGIPVLDSEREKHLLDKVTEQAGEEYEQGIRSLYRLLMDQSKLLQQLDGCPESPAE